MSLIFLNQIYDENKVNQKYMTQIHRILPSKYNLNRHFPISRTTTEFLHSLKCMNP